MSHISLTKCSVVIFFWLFFIVVFQFFIFFWLFFFCLYGFFLSIVDYVSIIFVTNSLSGIAVGVFKAALFSLKYFSAVRVDSYYGISVAVHCRLPTDIVCIVVENAITIAVDESTFTYLPPPRTWKVKIVVFIGFGFDFTWG